MKQLAVFLALLMVVVSFTGCASSTGSSSSTSSVSSTAVETVELNISAAASLTESLNKIAELYKETAPGIKLTFNFGASGTLQTQIEGGAPTDLFFSAAKKQMDALAEKSLIVTDTRKDLLVNKVVLITSKDSTADIKSFEDCLTSKVKMIAIGNPESVPVGQYAQEVFTYLKGWDKIKAKANLGADVKEVLTWTETGNVDCGVVYSTDAAASGKVKVICEAPADSHKKVVYPAALINTSTHQTEAKAFLDYLSTDAAKKVFTDSGFTIA